MYGSLTENVVLFWRNFLFKLLNTDDEKFYDKQIR